MRHITHGISRIGGNSRRRNTARSSSAPAFLGGCTVLSLLSDKLVLTFLDRRVLFFPYGNHVEHASFYLEHAWENEPPANWYACVQFALVLSNVNDPSIYISHGAYTQTGSRDYFFFFFFFADRIVVATHRFNADEGDWGFTRFCELRRLFSVPWEGRGVPLVQNEEAKITAYVRVVKDPTGVLWHSFQKYVLAQTPTRTSC